MKNQTVAQDAERRTITAAEFKAKCLRLMDEVNEKNLIITITKRGVPVMEVKAPPPENVAFVSLWGRSPNIKILGDIMAPTESADPTERSKRVQKKHKDKKHK